MTSYYDHILGLIPVAFAAIAATLHFTGFKPAVAIPIAGGVAVVLVGHALFVNGPVDDVADVGATTQHATHITGRADDRSPAPAAD
ncbi:hypothetical protein [Halarchaeum sp. P4]|uniref:hypothetical protein n=1 Tax=Halarchaeum sp. P4 TaxID=3421639 RepID=UPI003EBDA0B6